MKMMKMMMIYGWVGNILLKSSKSLSWMNFWVTELLKSYWNYWMTEWLFGYRYSKIRNPEIEDVKYVGRRVSRVDLDEDSEAEDEEDEDEDEDEDMDEDHDLNGDEDMNEDEEINSSFSEESNRSSNEEEEDLPLPPRPPPPTLTSSLSQDHTKGLAILQQTVRSLSSIIIKSS